MMLSYIPSPSRGVWHAGVIPIRAYALCILAGIVVAVLLTQKRWVARGGHADVVLDITVWAVPFGIVGGRLYHVITDPELYFGAGRDPVKAFYIWDGGLGIWGAVALGAVGAWIGCRQRGVSLTLFADALAPGLILAQAIGRWGNYFNQELFGSPTTLPWALHIDAAHRPADTPTIVYYHPTFLYESLWCAAACLLLLWADQRFDLRGGAAVRRVRGDLHRRAGVDRGAARRSRQSHPRPTAEPVDLPGDIPGRPRVSGFQPP